MSAVEERDALRLTVEVEQAKIAFRDKVIARLEARVTALEKALRNCPHDGGYDRELGPVGCILAMNDQACVCAGLFAALSPIGEEKR